MPFLALPKLYTIAAASNSRCRWHAASARMLPFTGWHHPRRQRNCTRSRPLSCRRSARRQRSCCSRCPGPRTGRRQPTSHESRGEKGTLAEKGSFGCCSRCPGLRTARPQPAEKRMHVYEKEKYWKTSSSSWAPYTLHAHRPKATCRTTLSKHKLQFHQQSQDETSAGSQQVIACSTW